MYHASVTHHRSSNKDEKSIVQRFLWPVVAVVAVIIIVAVVAWAIIAKGSDGTASAINTKEYQALFLTNGQVYFGKLQAFNGGYFKLTDVFYLESSTDTSTSTSKNPQQASTSQSGNLQLIKLGSAQVHDPEDQMVVDKTQVLFFENLKSDGKVTQSIQQYKNSHK